MNQESEYLYRLIHDHFNLTELREIFFELGIEREDAPAPDGAKSDLVIHLIGACQRTKRLQDLIAKCREKRQNIDWPDYQLLAGYAAEIQANFTTFWAERVALGDDNLQSLAERRPVEGVFSDKPPEESKPAAEARSTDPLEQPDGEQGDSETPPTAAAKTAETAASHPLAYATLKSRLLSAEPGFITLFIAEPGAGKTLWLHYLATDIAAAIAEPDTPIPIYLPLNTYAGEKDLGAFIRAVLRSDQQSPFHGQLGFNLTHEMKRRPLLLLMDGLNEISETSAGREVQKSRFTRALQAFVENHRAVCLVASREIDFMAGLDWPQIKIHPLDSMRVMKCLATYAPEDATDIYRLLDDKNLFGTLTSNPYRVRALCQIYKSRGRLPETVGLLFETFVATLVDREKERRVSQGEEWVSFDSWVAGVSELARWLTDSETTAIEVDKLALHLQDADMWSYAEGAGLLYRHDDRLQFSHQQLQEYFVARWLKTGLEAYGLGWDGFNAAIRKRVWDQPLLLLAGIVSPALLDSLIEPIAAVDPFLAGRCVGIDPARVSEATRQWLATYLAKGLSFAVINGDRELAREIVRAAGEMRCAEGLSVLSQPETAPSARRWAGSDYYRAVAQVNSAAAAAVLIAAIEEEATTPRGEWRQAIRECARALASMRVPEARRFLARSLFDRRIYQDVLPVVSEVDAGIGFGELKTLLAHDGFWHRDAEGVFPALAAAVARVAPRALLPDLLRFVDKPAAVETLLRFGAGQQVVDDYVRRHTYTMRRQAWEADARAFGIQHLSFMSIRRGAGDLIDLRNYLYHNAGEKAAGDFIDLLLAAVPHAQRNHQAPLAAMQALTTMRQIRVLPALRKLRAAEFPAPGSRWPDYGAVRNDDDLQHLINEAIEFLEEPRAMGVIHHPLNRFALALRGVGEEPDGKPLPAAIGELLDWAHREPERFDRYAVQALEGLAERVKHRGLGYEYRELLSSAAGYLAERGRPELSETLVRMLVTAAESEGEDSWESIAAISEQLIAHGQSRPEQRRGVAERLAPLVHRPNRQLQLAAVKVLALIDAGEYCAEWLEYLSDRTWPLAYVIVDALGCMTVPAATREMLAAQLLSVYADERYFAVLALGSIGQVEDLPHVLALSADFSIEVRRAVLWAISQLGASDPGVVGVLAGGLASPHARLRREAANAIGELRLQALNRELRHALEDIDLHVVERAAWALGRLDDHDSVAALMNALARVVCQADWEYKPGLHQRVEYRLRETIVASLAQIRVGVDKETVTKHLLREKGLFPALVAGRLDERAPDRVADHAAEYTEEPEESDSAAGQQALAMATREELQTIARRAADPRQRKQALALLGEEVRDYESFNETIPRRDPHLEVQLEILRIAAGRGRDYYGAMYSFTGNPSYDLKLSRELGDAGPELALYVPLPEAWNAPTALWLAQRFPDAYNMQPLTTTLAASLEAPYELGYSQTRTLCSLLDRQDVALYFLAGKVSWHLSDTLHGLPSGDTSWSPSIPYLLAQRRVWGIVPRLLEGLSQDKHGSIDAFRGAYQSSKRWNLTVIEALCELGVYQASDLIQETLAQLNPDQDVEVAVAQVMAQVELSGHFGKKLPERFRDKEFLSSAIGFGAGEQFLYILSNILAESDSGQDFEEGLKLEAELSWRTDIGNLADSSWLDRRLRRWGQQHLRGLIQTLANAGDHELIEQVSESLMPYDQHHYITRRAKEIARAVRRCPEAMLAAWLEDDSWAVRWVGFCGLADTGNTALDEHALRLLEDGNPQVFEGLLRRADQAPLPALFRFLQGETDLSLGGRNEQVARQLHRAVVSHLGEADPSVKRAIISVLGQHRTRRFASALSHIALNGEPDTVIEALEALREIGDRSQAAALRPLLDSPDLDVLEAAIETLAVLRYRPASARLLELLEHPERNIQVAATGACALMQIRKAIPLLRQRLLALKAPPPPPPDGDVAAPDAEGYWQTNEAELERRQAVEMTEFALFLLHATPRLSVGGMDFNTGDGLLALCSIYWLFLPTPLRLGWRLRMSDSGLPYPLPLLPLDDSQLIVHAMRRDLRAAPWTNRTLREMLPASMALFVKRWEAEPAEKTDDAGPRQGPAAVPWPFADETAADTLVAAVLDALGPLERRLSEGWDAVRAKWAADVEALDLATLDALDEDPPPDVIWAVLKSEIVDTFDRLLSREQGHSARQPFPTGGFYGGYRMLEDLGLSDHYSVLLSLIRAAHSPSAASVEVDDNLRPLLDVIDEGELQLLIACQGLAQLYFTCALLAGWGYSVLRQLQEQFANPELGTGYEERVASYLWPEGGIPGALAIVPDNSRPPGEKVNPLVSMDAPPGLTSPAARGQSEAYPPTT